MQEEHVALIIEHDAITLAGLEAALVQEGFRTLSANTWRTGVDMAFRCGPDLILYDLDMPDALYVFYALKHSPRTAPIPSLMISAVGDLAAPSAEVGADLFLSKPFGSSERRAALQNLPEIIEEEDPSSA